MATQITTWGSIEWLSKANRDSRSMNIGIVTIAPYAHQERHIHYESEQFIYILQGEGIDIIDGVKRPFSTNMFYRLDPNITHEVINPTNAEIRHLLVSVSTTWEEPVDPISEPDNYSECFCSAVESIRSQLTKNVWLPVAIFDDLSNLLLQNGNYPAFCEKKCAPTQNPGQCPCFSFENDGIFNDMDSLLCPYGLTVFHLPVSYLDHNMGWIVSGHILFGGREDVQLEGMYDTPYGTVLAIQDWMKKVRKSLVSFCSFNAVRQSLTQKELAAARTRQDQDDLRASLKVMQNAVANLKIDRHFLYNTLNAIAGEALEMDRMTTYQSIVDLAKMFRYATNRSLQIVPLMSELEYLKTYLHMQQIRYRKNLKVQIDVEDTALNARVPFNFLQPIVENAFTHGFSDYIEEKVLRLNIHHKENRLRILVANNGTLISPVALRRAENGMCSNNGHGMSLVYERLEAIYEQNFSIDITSDVENGTVITIDIPYEPQSAERGAV